MGESWGGCGIRLLVGDFTPQSCMRLLVAGVFGSRPPAPKFARMQGRRGEGLMTEAGPTRAGNKHILLVFFYRSRILFQQAKQFSFPTHIFRRLALPVFS